MNLKKLNIKVDFEDDEVFKGSFNNFPSAKKLLKDLEKKFK